MATAADELKLERRRKKEEKVSMQAYETHVANMEKVHASSVRAYAGAPRVHSHCSVAVWIARVAVYRLQVG